VSGVVVLMLGHAMSVKRSFLPTIMVKSPRCTWYTGECWTENGCETPILCQHRSLDNVPEGCYPVQHNCIAEAYRCMCVPTYELMSQVYYAKHNQLYVMNSIASSRQWICNPRKLTSLSKRVVRSFTR